MKVLNVKNQTLVSKKYQLNETNENNLDNFIEEIKIPSSEEIIGTIYAFINNKNGKIYIGQTMCKYYERFGKHFNDAKKDFLYFHNAINKYGWNNFSKYILWQDTNIYEKTTENKKIVSDLLDEKETYYIALYNSDDPNFGYNLTPGGKKENERMHSKSSINKLRKYMLEHNPMFGKTYSLHHLARKVNQYDIKGGFIKTWDCIKEAEDYYNIDIYLKNYSSGGFIWIASDEFNEELLNSKISKLEEINNSKIKGSIYQVDFDGEIVNIFNNLSSVKAFLKKDDVNNISTTLKAKDKGNVCFDYIWILEEDINNKDFIVKEIKKKSKIYKRYYKPIYQIFLNGDVIKL